MDIQSLPYPTSVHTSARADPVWSNAQGQALRLYDRLRPLGIERRFESGQTLYEAAEPFRALYWLRSGTVKRSSLQPNGREQILGFAFPGDLLGLASLGSPSYQATATAIEFGMALEIPALRLQNAIEEDPVLRQLLLSRLGEALRDRHAWMLTLGAVTAEERVAAFLLDLARRMAQRGYAAERLTLKMSRAEIGALLGLTLETVSRTLSRFKRNGLIGLKAREIELRDRQSLLRLAHGERGLTH